MKITQTYEVPFDSSYDWRTTFVQAFTELARKSAVSVLKRVDAEEFEMPWGDFPEDMIKNSVRNDLFPRLISAMEIRAKAFANR